MRMIRGCHIDWRQWRGSHSCPSKRSRYGDGRIRATCGTPVELCAWSIGSGDENRTKASH